MNKDALNIFKMVIDNSNDINKEITNEVYKLLGINSNSDKITEFVHESLENFSFNLAEKNFLEQIKETIIEELSIIKNQENNNINKDVLTEKIIEKLKNIENININIEDDLKVLSKQMVEKFPYIQLSSDQLYLHFISKKEAIINSITSQNKNIIDVLVKLTPIFIDELGIEKQEETKNNKVVNQQAKKEEEKSQESKEFYLDILINKCMKKLNELETTFDKLSIPGVTKSEAAKVYRQLKKFVENLENETFAQETINTFINSNEVSQDLIYDEIIYQNIPMMKEIFEKIQQSSSLDNGSYIEEVSEVNHNKSSRR